MLDRTKECLRSLAVAVNTANDLRQQWGYCIAREPESQDRDELAASVQEILDHVEEAAFLLSEL